MSFLTVSGCDHDTPLCDAKRKWHEMANHSTTIRSDARPAPEIIHQASFIDKLGTTNLAPLDARPSSRLIYRQQTQKTMMNTCATDPICFKTIALSTGHLAKTLRQTNRIIEAENLAKRELGPLHSGPHLPNNRP
jgi:hypothetical protein